MTEGSCCLRWTVEQISRQQDWRRHTITVGDSVEEVDGRDESDLLRVQSGQYLAALDHRRGWSRNVLVIPASRASFRSCSTEYAKSFTNTGFMASLSERGQTAEKEVLCPERRHR